MVAYFPAALPGKMLGFGGWDGMGFLRLLRDRSNGDVLSVSACRHANLGNEKKFDESPLVRGVGLLVAELCLWSNQPKGKGDGSSSPPPP